MGNTCTISNIRIFIFKGLQNKRISDKFYHLKKGQCETKKGKSHFYRTL